MTSIDKLLQQNEQADLLRITTAGSVDDGKSTLIGRLLFEAKGIFEDQLDSIRSYSAANHRGEFDYSLVTDGLKAEREQGITIDVAYRFFTTPKRRFIIADTPGHEQYTRNMATGASTAQLALILLDATKGVVTQTRRHTFISSLLGIRHIVVAVNKMDLVNYDENVFDQIVADYRLFADKLPVDTIHFVPLSALKGDNVVEESTNMPWFKGGPLLDYLENVTVMGNRNLIDFRFPVQHVIWTGKTFRGYAGTISSGIIRPGEEVTVLPSGVTTKVQSISTWDGELAYAFAPQAVTLTLEDDVDISRGDMLVRTKNVPAMAREVEAGMVWMSETPLAPGSTYLFKHCSRYVKGTVRSLKYRLDPQDLHRKEADSFKLNEIGKAHISFVQSVFADEYTDNRNTGSFVIVDPVTNLTLGAGMITKTILVSEAGIGKGFKSVEAVTIWQTDEPITAADTEPMLRLDWTTLESGLNADLPSVAEKLVRIAHICKMANDSGIDVLVTAPEPPDEHCQEIIGIKRLRVMP